MKAGKKVKLLMSVFCVTLLAISVFVIAAVCQGTNGSICIGECCIVNGLHCIAGPCDVIFPK